MPTIRPSKKKSGRNILNLIKQQKMLADVMRNPKFSYIFSFLLGVGLVVIVLGKDCAPQESGKSSCKITKAPAPDEVKKAIYLIDSDCYKFTTKTVKCPASAADVVESFGARSGSHNY